MLGQSVPHVSVLGQLHFGACLAALHLSPQNNFLQTLSFLPEALLPSEEKMLSTSVRLNFLPLLSQANGDMPQFFLSASIPVYHSILKVVFPPDPASR